MSTSNSSQRTQLLVLTPGAPPVQPKPPAHTTTKSAARFDKNEYAVVKEFPWRKIGGYISNDPEEVAKQNKLEDALKKNEALSKKPVLSKNNSTNDMMSKTSVGDQASVVQNFVVEKFYSDFYWNTVMMIGTCYFSWVMGRIGGGIFALMFVFLCTTSVYRAEFRRFNRDLRDDMTRVAAYSRLENSAETMEWLNSFMSKFWIIYMPALSELVMNQANQVLAGAAPGFGIDDLSLDQFTLGSKAPTVDSIKSFTKLDKNTVQMDWAFSFAPNETDNMTKNEIRKKIDPKVALGVRVGKGFVSKNLPILVEDMQFIGRMRITLKLSHNFPHIKMVSISFLEPPQIEYGLKPVGGDTLGLDIMSLIPGLSSFVNSLIHSNLGPMMYAPNSLDLDIEELMAGQGNDAIGVVAVTLSSADTKETIDGYIEMNPSNFPDKKYRSAIKKNSKSPRWNETQYVLVNSLEQQLEINLWDFNEFTSNKLIGSTSFDLNELMQNENFDNIDTGLKLSGKDKGHLRYSLKWFPVQQGEVMEDGTREAPPETEVGILKLVVNEAKGIDTSVSKVGELSPYAEVFIGDKLVKTSRILKRTNEPAWGEEIETLITAKSSTKVKVLIKDSNSFTNDPVVAKYDGDLQSVLFQILEGNDIFKLSPKGGLRLTAQWKPLSLTGVSTSVNYVPAFGALRIHIRSAKDLKNLETVGLVDPYVRVMLNGRSRYQTLIHDDTLEPIFEEMIYLPISTEKSHLQLEVMDAESNSKDRTLGSHTVDLNLYVNKTEQGYWIPYDGANETVVAPLQIHNKKPKGTISYSISFIPTIPVYSPTELDELKKEKEKEAELAAEEEKEQEKLQKIYDENPDEWEWYDADEEEEKEKGPEKKIMPLNELIQYQSGVLGMHFEKAEVSKTDAYFQILFDLYSQPSFAASRAKGRSINTPETEDAFIRDLANSTMTMRVVKHEKVDEDSDIVDIQSYKVLDLLQKGYNKSIPISVGESKVMMKFEYIPSAVELPDSETMMDTGVVDLQILDATGLLAADRGGKSDPYAEIKINDKVVYKTDKHKRTLNPVWNETCQFPIYSRARAHAIIEVFDWDVAGKNDELGFAEIGLAKLKIDEETEFKVNLNTQGSVHLIAKFHPQYYRPELQKFGRGGVSKSDITGAPMKIAGAGLGAVGAVGGGVKGGVKGGGQLVKGLFGGGRKKKISEIPSLGSTPRSSMESNSSARSSVLLKDDQGSTTGNGFITNGFVRRNNDNEMLPPPIVGTGVHELQSLRSGRGVQSSSASVATMSTSSPSTADISHRRTSSSASNERTKSDGGDLDVYPGRLSILSLNGLITKRPLQVKVTLNRDTTDVTDNNSGKVKNHEIYKTRKTKSKEGFISFKESSAFKAAPSYAMTFQVVEHHTIGKLQDIGKATIQLSEVLGKTEEISLDLQIPQEVDIAKLDSTSLVVSFNYHPPNDSSK